MPEQYDLRLSDVRQQLDELPPQIRDAVWRVLPRLTDVDPTTVTGKTTRKHRQDVPPLEIEYEIDPVERQVDIRFISFSAFKPRQKVFISYSHKNSKWFEELRPYMKSLELRDQLTGLPDEHGTVLTDEKLKAGDEWRRCLIDFIGQSRIAVLVVTQDFMVSDFIREEELPRILQRHREGTQEIHWLSFEPAVFVDDSPFKKIQAAHAPLEPPLCDRQLRKRQKVYKELTEQLLKRLEQVTDDRL
jgi:hypothetical protein